MPRESITGYHLLDWVCEAGGCSKRADIEITYVSIPVKTDPIEQGLAAIIFGAMPFTKHFCTEHSPIDIKGEKARWNKRLQEPFGT